MPELLTCVLMHIPYVAAHQHILCKVSAAAAAAASVDGPELPAAMYEPVDGPASLDGPAAPEGPGEHDGPE